jgi:signal transduction histidine kinase
MPFLGSALARRTLAFLLAGAVALLAIVAVSVWLASRTDSHAAEAARSRQIRIAANGLLSSVLEAESGQRGFLLTEEPRYLEFHDGALSRMKIGLGRLRELVGGDPAAVAAVDRLQGLVATKFGEMARTIDLSAAGRSNEALAIIRSDLGKNVMDEIRGVLNGLGGDAEARVERRLGDLNAAARMLVWITVAGGALIAVFAGAALWTVARYTDDLVEARHQVEALNTDLEQRVTERTADLARANDEIQRFAYIVSHDLRAPLVNVMGFTSELEIGAAALKRYIEAEQPDDALAEAARAAASEDLPEAVRFIRASTGKMDRLISAILKLSREGRRELRPERIDLGRVLGAAAASVQHQLDKAGARIEIADGMPVIRSDRLALEQVFGNLIDNAVKYLSPGRPGLIRISAEDRRRRVEITVSDNGRGIDPKDHERIFELFRRSGEHDRPGEGIGLAHVRALVRRLGGDVTVQSRLGEGASFKIDLPKTTKINESAQPT